MYTAHPYVYKNHYTGSQRDDLVYIDEIPLRQFQPNY